MKHQTSDLRIAGLIPVTIWNSFGLREFANFEDEFSFQYNFWKYIIRLKSKIVIKIKFARSQSIPDHQMFHLFYKMFVLSDLEMQVASKTRGTAIGTRSQINTSTTKMVPTRIGKSNTRPFWIKSVRNGKPKTVLRQLQLLCKHRPRLPNHNRPQLPLKPKR